MKILVRYCQSWGNYYTAFLNIDFSEDGLVNMYQMISNKMNRNLDMKKIFLFN